MWEFSTVRELAIGGLSQPDLLDDISKVYLGTKYGIPRWLLSGCKGLVTRNNGPTDTEARYLGLDITSKIWDLRVRRIKAVYGTTYSPFDLETEINVSFKDYYSHT